MRIHEAFKLSDKARIEGLDIVCDKRYDRTFQIPLYLVLAKDWQPVYEPLTFERIKRECVPGETLFRLCDKKEFLFLGFNRQGSMVTDGESGYGAIHWDEEDISNFKISSKKREG